MAGWQVGRLAGWQVERARVAYWPRLAGWQVGRLADWQLVRVAWPIGQRLNLQL
ncbi:MAG: hypothetical protein F6K50_30015 [Moorea sp. SIO3I7]|nr:hypothetical protein [Moorena sp. SIO3I7]